MVTRSGGRHCGGVRFEVVAPAKIAVSECNCWPLVATTASAAAGAGALAWGAIGANHVDAGANRVDFTLVAITFDRNDAEMGALRVGLEPKRDRRALAGAPFSIRSGAIAKISIARDANDADRAPHPRTVDVHRAGVDAIRALFARSSRRSGSCARIDATPSTS